LPKFVIALFVQYPWLRQFISFGFVGVAGLVVDATVLWLMLHGFGLDRYTGRIPSYIAAATATWALNRRFTFQGMGEGSLFRQWLKFLFANLSGLAANFGTYTACVTFIPIAIDYPLLGLIPASIAGLAFNFIASKHLVFK
jgi:putative flippase GtrA